MKNLEYTASMWICLIGAASSFFNPWNSATHCMLKADTKLRMSSCTDTVAETSSNKYVAGPNVEGPGEGRRKPTKDPFNPQFKPAADFGDAYPNSEKRYKVSRQTYEFVVQSLIEVNKNTFFFAKGIGEGGGTKLDELFWYHLPLCVTGNCA